MSKQIIGIVAIDKNYGIGKGRELPWPRHAEDMAFFKNATQGHTVIMGYNTFLSLGLKPLPNRHNIVILSEGRKADVHPFDNVTYVTNNVDKILKLARETSPTNKIFCIGGSATYKMFDGHYDLFYFTKFSDEYDCDVFFDHTVFDGLVYKGIVKTIEGGVIEEWTR